jgi:hypothetical protein
MSNPTLCRKGTVTSYKHNPESERQDDKNREFFHELSPLWQALHARTLPPCSIRISRSLPDNSSP